MQKKEFIRQLNELVPRPDPVTTEALYRFDRECAETEYIDMLTALRVVARNFSEETLQSAYEIIQNQNAALPSELFTAAVYLQPGVHRQRCPVWPGRAGLWASLARSGRRSSAGLRPAPLWSLGGSNGFTPWTSGGSTTACLEAGHNIQPGSRYIRHPAMARLTMDQPEFAEKPGGPRCILDGLAQSSPSVVPALAGLPRRGRPYHLPCGFGYHRDSLSSSVAGAKPESGGHPADVKKLLDITGTLWYVVCLPEERAGKSYEPSEETEHAQEPR